MSAAVLISTLVNGSRMQNKYSTVRSVRDVPINSYEAKKKRYAHTGIEGTVNTYTSVDTLPGFDRHHVQAPRPKTKLQTPTTV